MRSRASTEPVSSCRADSAGALTEAERLFAAKNHDLIFSFLNTHGRDERDYYDIAAFGYLSAVRRYLSDPGLHRHAFSTIAWRAMAQSIASFHRAETRRREAEHRYLETAQRADPMAELEARLFLHDLASAASPEQYRLAALRLQGYPVAELARAQGMPARRIRKLLRELYRVYFQLYLNGK